MLLQTQIPLKKQSENLVDYNSKLLLIGSCFSENIGKQLNYYKLQTIINPFGILFHPKAIEYLVTNSIIEKQFTEKDIFCYNERWHSFNTHSSLSKHDKTTLLEHLNSTIATTKRQIKEASHIIFTLGTSWIYKHITSNKIVANCHKISQKEFSKEILSANEISKSLETIVSSIQEINQNCKVIFTVSPVRHIKDGFIENTQSKSHLISGIHQFLASNKNKNTSSYFPSYEIMMDELRDYRFYNEDMIHPNQTAINFIWQKFTSVWFSDSALKTMLKVEDIQKRMNHKPFNPNSEAHQKFIEKLTQKKQSLIKEFPFMQF